MYDKFWGFPVLDSSTLHFLLSIFNPYFMKKLLKFLAIFIVFLLAAMVSIPFFFKDKIQAKVNTEISKKVNATFYYKDFGLSFFKHFPQITVSLSDFGVVGKSPFVGDTLINAQSFNVSLDVKSVFSGGEIQVNHIGLDAPKILVKVLKDGSKNYDILKKSEVSPDDKNVQPSDFQANINEWKITDGQMIYDDKLQNTLVEMKGVNHEGSGEISTNIYDLLTKTEIQNATILYNGKEFLKDKKIMADMALNIDNGNKKYAFKDNTLTINDFPIKFNGFVALPEANKIKMDITYSTEESDFKKILSLVPGVFTEKFSSIKADGKVIFGGNFKGEYSATTFPSFDFDLKIQNGQFQYPDLPTAVTGINLDMTASNTTEDLNNTVIDLKKFAMNLGQNPVKGRVLLEGLRKMKVDADIDAKLDLQQVEQMFPMKGLAMKGLYNVKLKAKGIYDSLSHQFPEIDGQMVLKNGFIKSDKFPEPIDNLNINASILNQDGALSSTKLMISDLRMVMQNEPFEASGTITNFENPSWEIKAKGKIDLTKITKVYPLNDMTLKGKLDADIETKGMMADVKAKRYAKLPTSGKAKVSGFEFVSKQYPQGIKVTQADLNFTPQNIQAKNVSGFLGTSDFVGEGTMSNYIGYALNNETIKGEFDVKSQKFNVNEWMTDSPKSAGNSTQKQLVEIPKNIDLKLNAAIAEVLYDKMKMKDTKGVLNVGGGALKLQNVRFDALGGSFTTDGTYNTKDVAKPTFDFALGLENVNISEAYQNLTVVKALMPIAEYILGDFTSKFKINGDLGQDMMPKLQSVSGEGIVKVLKATVQKNDMVDKLVETTKLNKLKDLQLNNLLMAASIKDGKLEFKPFDLKYEDYKMTIAGLNYLDGAINYDIKMDVPTGNIGQAFNTAFLNWTGKNLQGTDRVKFDLKLGGTYKTPKFAFNGSSTAISLKDAVTAQAKAQIEAAKAKALEEADKLRKEAEAKILAEKDRLLKEAEAKKTELEAKAKAEIQKQKDAIETKAQAAVDSIKRAASERAKKLLEEQKKNVLDGLFKKPKPVKKDSV